MSEPTQQPVWYTEDQAKALIDQAVANALSQHAETQAAQQQSTGSLSASQVQAIVDEALSRQAEAHNAAMQALSASMRGSVASLIPEHSGGAGTEVADTWSQYEQELSHAASEAKLRAA